MNQHPPTLLYIDDDAALARLVERGLTRRGYKVIHAASGEEGLERIRRAGTQNSADGCIDVVALDQYMPGLDGLETLEQIMAIPGAPPVVFVTASQDSSIAVTALKAGAADYLVKDVKGDFIPCSTSPPTARCARPNCRRRARKPRPRSTHRATATPRSPPNASCCCARSITASATRSRSSPRCCISRRTPPARKRSRRR